MNKYLGIKLISATPELKDGVEGYSVVYPDGYKSWSPKDVFEKAYFQVGENNTIQEKNVHDFIKSYEVVKHRDKTTVVHATLVNGFIITEACSCVDPQNFSIQIGTDICKERIINKVWELLGFTLQCGVTGIKQQEEKEEVI